MAGFHEVQFPTNISYGSSGGPEFSTGIVELDSGSEERVSRWGTPRRRYQAGYAIRTRAQLYAVQQFVIARDGQAFGFRYKDWLDFTTAVDGYSAHASTNQLIGTGDGTQTVFQMVKVYTSGGINRTRNLTKPVSATALVAVNEITVTTGFTVNYTTGLITFTTAPTAGHTVKCGCEFDTPVRFDMAHLDISIESFDNGSLDVPMVEVRDDGQSNDDFFYGGALRHGQIAANLTLSLLDGRVQQVEPTVAGLKAFLPDASDLPGGGPYLYLANEGAEAISVRNSSDIEIVSLPGGNNMVELVLAVDAITSARTWISK